MRIARRNEERLRAELEEARKASAPAPAPAVAKPSVDKLKDVADFDPEVATYLADLEKQNKELAAKAAAAPAPASEKTFEPERFDPAVQEVIDAVPDMLAMQMNPDQTAFTLAKSMDSVLRAHPVWSAKTIQERFQEVVRRVGQELGSTTAAPSPTQSAQPGEAERLAAIARAQAAAAPAPVAIGDLRGGNTPTNETPDYSRMNDDDVMNDLDKFA